MTDYESFLLNKITSVQASGFTVAPDEVSALLYPYQRDVVRWALSLGRAALFEERGLGKTAQQLEWSRLVAKHTGGKVIIAAPLAVAAQTVAEGKKFGIDVKYCLNNDDIGDAQIIITNYERLEKFDLSQFVGVVLDESSILKGFTTKTKLFIIEAFKNTPYKLACTATPAPNDNMELGNHAEFLNVMRSDEMTSRWFINDGTKSGSWRLKRHAKDDFYRWLTSWAVYVRHPRDLGDEYDMPGFDLPELHIVPMQVATSQITRDRTLKEGRLIPGSRTSSTELHAVKRESLAERIAEVVKIVSDIPEDEPIIIWCEQNSEADALKNLFDNSVEVRGSHSLELKEKRLTDFTEGRARIIITKPSIAGWGLNWQHCRRQIFVSLSYSFEMWYQAVGRCHRFGQEREVYVYMVHSETEDHIEQTRKDKHKQFGEMGDGMNKAMAKHGLFRKQDKAVLQPAQIDKESGRGWDLIMGDCVPNTAALADNTIDFSIYSPPFANIFVFNDTEADMSNVKDNDEFEAHYAYLVKDLYRATQPGRLTAVHCCDLPVYKWKAGWASLDDFSGRIMKVHLDAGWVYHSRITIWKDPEVEMLRTHAHGLLHANFAQRSQVVRVGMPDYLLVFAKPDLDGIGQDVKQQRAPGDYIGTEPPGQYEYEDKPDRRPDWYKGTSDEYEYSVAVWERYASPVWFDINQTRVLNGQIARGQKDERHISPLQLDVIARAVQLWTNPGDLVYSPFAGVGSEGYESLKLKRRFLGVELKREYFDIATKYLKEAELLANQVDMFEMFGVAVDSGGGSSNGKS